MVLEDFLCFKSLKCLYWFLVYLTNFKVIKKFDFFCFIVLCLERIWTSKIFGPDPTYFISDPHHHCVMVYQLLYLTFSQAGDVSLPSVPYRYLLTRNLTSLLNTWALSRWPPSPPSMSQRSPSAPSAYNKYTSSQLSGDYSWCYYCDK